jgi:ribosomal protein L11 methyltransferase
MIFNQPKDNNLQTTTVWIEIKVAVPLSWADAVANYLMEQGANGIAEENQVTSAGIASADRNIILNAYFKKDASISCRISAIRNYLTSLSSLTGATKFELITNEIEDQDWNAQWKSFFQPIKVTQRIVIKPSWTNYWKRADEIIIELDPGMAFGTGTHPSTRLCLQAIEEIVDKIDEHNKHALLDVGTGSGILAIAAALLGIPHVVGIDIDYQAVACAKNNAKKNNVSGKIILSDMPLHTVNGLFSIIVANILPQTLIDLKKDLINHLAPCGYLILSGILKEKAMEVTEAFAGDISFNKETEDEGWSCLVFNRS